MLVCWSPNACLFRPENRESRFFDSEMPCEALFFHLFECNNICRCSCRRRALRSVSQSAAAIRDTRSTATDIRSDSYASYGESRLLPCFIIKNQSVTDLELWDFIDKYRSALRCINRCTDRDILVDTWPAIPPRTGRCNIIRRWLQQRRIILRPLCSPPL